MVTASPLLRSAQGIEKRARFIAYAAAARLRPGTVRNILFPTSRPDWEPVLRRGCRAAGYESTFAPLEPENIRAHDLVIPLTIEDLTGLDQHRELVAANPIPIPNLESVLLCDDKLKFTKALAEKGFGDFVPPVRPDPDFPYILKKSVDEGSANCHLVSNDADRRALTALAEDRRYFTQFFVPGRREYVTHLVVRNRQVVCALEYEYTFVSSTPVKLKDPVAYRRVRKSPHIELFGSILNTIGFEGLCCVNYKSVDHHPWILEINPRMGGSLGTFLFSFLRHL